VFVQNLILEGLPAEERSQLVGCSARVELEQHDRLYEPGAPMDHVYFPQSGLVSLLTYGENGGAIETGIVGREGMIGGIVALGAFVSCGSASVHIKGYALKIAASDFLRLNQALPVLSARVNRHLHFLLFQAQHNAVCHALHSIEARLCRWLLQASDMLGNDVVELTQEICSNSLGVQRTSVSMIAHGLQVAGHIRTRRGKILILNRPALEKTACECYETIKQQAGTVFAKPVQEIYTEDKREIRREQLALEGAVL
jgi:CRP-like cAMP-binding protein